MAQLTCNQQWTKRWFVFQTISSTPVSLLSDSSSPRCLMIAILQMDLCKFSVHLFLTIWWRMGLQQTHPTYLKYTLVTLFYYIPLYEGLKGIDIKANCSYIWLGFSRWCVCVCHLHHHTLASHSLCFSLLSQSKSWHFCTSSNLCSIMLNYVL